MRKKYLIGSINSCASIVSTFGMNSTSDSITANIDLDIIKDNIINEKIKCLGVKRFENGDKLYENIQSCEKDTIKNLYIKEPKSDQYNNDVNSINITILNCTNEFLEDNEINFSYNDVNLIDEIEKIENLKNLEEIDLLTLFLYESLYYYDFKFPNSFIPAEIHDPYALSDEGYTTKEQREEILKYKEYKKPFCQFIYNKISSSNILKSQDSKDILKNMFNIFNNSKINFDVDEYKKKLIGGINENLNKGIYLNKGYWGSIYYLNNYKNLLLKEYFNYHDSGKKWDEDYKLEQEIKRVFNFINVKINKNKLFNFANEEFHIYNELEIIEKVDLSVSTGEFKNIFFDECKLDNKLDVLHLIFTKFLNSLNNYKNIIKTYPGDRNDQNILFKSCNNEIKMINIDYIDFFEKYPLKDSIKYIVGEKKIIEFDIRNKYFDYYNVDLYLAILNKKRTLYDLITELSKDDRDIVIQTVLQLIANKNVIDKNRPISLHSIIFDNNEGFYISQNNLPYKKDVKEYNIFDELTKDKYIFERDIFDEGEILKTGYGCDYLPEYRLKFQDNEIATFDIIKLNDYIYELKFSNFNYNYSYLFNSAYDVIIKKIYNDHGKVIVCTNYNYDKLPEKNNFLSHYYLFNNNNIKLSEINKRINEFTNLDINADNILSLNFETLDKKCVNVFLPNFDYFKSKYSIDSKIYDKTPKPYKQTIPFINKLCLERLSHSDKLLLRYLYKSLNNIFEDKSYMGKLLKLNSLNSRITYFNNIGLSYLLLWCSEKINSNKKKYYEEKLYYRLLSIKHIPSFVEKIENYMKIKFFNKFINKEELPEEKEPLEDDEENNNEEENKSESEDENEDEDKSESEDDSKPDDPD